MKISKFIIRIEYFFRDKIFQLKDKHYTRLITVIISMWYEKQELKERRIIIYLFYEKNEKLSNHMNARC